MEKNADLNHRIDTMETILKNRESTIEKLREELNDLQKADNIAENHASELENDLRELQDHIAAMENENADLIEKLKEWQRKDDEVKEMLDRKVEVDESKNKSGNKLGEAVNALDKIKNSPNRKKTINIIGEAQQA